MEPQKEKPDPITRAHNTINQAEDLIAGELERTNNSWFACLGSRVSTVETLLDTAALDGQISSTERNSLQKRLDLLKVDLKKARTDFSTDFSEAEPPSEVKEKLLKELNIFAEPEEGSGK